MNGPARALARTERQGMNRARKPAGIARFRPALLRRRGGAAVVEFAIVISLFLGLVMGIMEFSRFINAWLSVQHAARSGARYAITGRTDCNLDPDTPLNNRLACIEVITRRSAVGLLHGAVSVSVRAWDFPDFVTLTEGSAGGPCDAFEVSVFYPFEFVVPILSNFFGTVTVEGRERMVIEPYGSCGT